MNDGELCSALCLYPNPLLQVAKLIKAGPSIELKGHCSYETLRLGLGSGLLFVMKFLDFGLGEVL